MKQIVKSVLGLVVVAAMLSGCATAAIQGASRAKDQAVIASNEDAAAKGDPVAQYKVGEAHCCSIAGSMGVLNNQEATHWFCKAAAQGNADAEYELGRIYSGDLVRGMNGPAKIGALLTKQPENLPLSLMWFNLAALHGNTDAADKAADVRKKMTPLEIAGSAVRQRNVQMQPCEWNDVYPDKKI
jgi:TPR repeat protein